MSVVDDFLKKMKMVSDDDDYDSDDEYDDYDDDYDAEEELPVKKTSKKAQKKRADYIEEDDDADEEDRGGYYSQAAPAKKAQPKESKPVYTSKSANVTSIGGSGKLGSTEVCMILPKSFEDANTIADILLSHKVVVLNLEGIDMAAAQRIIDFASGACYTVGGNLQKISKKIFIVVPSDVNLSGDFGDIIGDMVDLNAVNMR